MSNTTNTTFFYICYQPLAEFLGDGDTAGLLQRINYWLQNDKTGYILGDGSKWIYFGYKKIQKQLSWLSEHQIGRMIRALENVGWLISDKFYNLKRNIGFANDPPDFHEDNQRKWYKLDYQQIYMDTGFTFDNVVTPPKEPKRAPRAKVQNCTVQSTNLHDATCETAQSSIYKEDPNSHYQKETVVEEKEKIDFYQEKDFDPWSEELIPDAPEIPSPNESAQKEPPLNNSEPHEGQCSAAPGQGFEKRFKPESKRNSEAVEKEIWEIAPSRPYPVFLNWWADKKYKPQGGRWEADAIGNAYSEFYNKRDRTTVAIFPQFLEYMQQVAENCNQQLAAGIKAILPSCFVAKPDATHGNVEQLMQNISELVDRGVQVALPTNSVTPACSQSMNFAIAASSDISALGNLVAVVPEQITPVVENDFLELLARKQMMWNIAPALRNSIRKWAECTPGVQVTEAGVVLIAVPEQDE